MITPEFEEWYLSQFPEDLQEQARANLEGARQWEVLQARTAESNNETVPDYYALLGVPRFYATQDEISVAYMTKVKALYSDANATPEAAREKTQRLNEAFDTLRETASKRQYDEILAKYLEAKVPIKQTITPTKPIVPQNQVAAPVQAPKIEPVVHQKVKTRPKWKRIAVLAIVAVLAASCIIVLVNHSQSVFFADAPGKEFPNEVGQPTTSETSGTDEIRDQYGFDYTTTNPISEPSASYTRDERIAALRELGEKIREQGYTSSPVDKPQNGEIVYQKSGINTSITGPLEVETSGDNDYFIKLRNHSTGEEVLSFYVHGGSSAEIEVPLGNYDITYACGEVWYGVVGLFGVDTSCYKADSTFEFYEEAGYVNGWTLTLYPVVDGNLDTDRIDFSEF